MTSKIKVDNIENQCGGAVVTKCGATTTISGSVVKADDIQAADGGNLVSQSGTTITLGASGDTINLASGASQSGFGRTGTVDWITTPKTATFTAVSGEGYFCNTSGGAFTANLPAGSAGAIVSFADYSGTFGTNALNISANGSEKIGGETTEPILNTNGQSVTLVYVDATEGWVTTSDSSENIAGSAFIVATGGTISTSGDCRIHTFTGPGTFSVVRTAISAPDNAVEYLVVASGGGGGGGNSGSGGGSGAGGGGYRTNFPGSGTPVTVQGYPIVVGGGGAGGPSAGAAAGNGANGNTSSALGISSAGGGNGRGGPCAAQAGEPGGSGGGASGGSPSPLAGGSGNTPPVSPPQGNSGGSSGTCGGGSIYDSAGGGGAGGVGQNSQPGPRAGGVGSANSISGSAVTYAAGGRGGNYNGSPEPNANEPDNSGNGGVGKSGGPSGSNPGTGGTGGSGIVIIRYKFQ